MPDVNAAATFTKDTAGFDFLKSFINGKTAEPFERRLFFDGASPGTSITIKYVDDQGVDRDFPDNVITTLPAVKIIEPCYLDIKLVVAGTPDFNVTGDNPQKRGLSVF